MDVFFFSSSRLVHGVWPVCTASSLKKPSRGGGSGGNARANYPGVFPSTRRAI